MIAPAAEVTFTAPCPHGRSAEWTAAHLRTTEVQLQPSGATTTTTGWVTDTTCHCDCEDAR